MNDTIQVKSKIFQDYVDAMRRGELNCSFEEYWNSRKPEVERWLNSHNDSVDRNQNHMFLQSANMPNRGIDDDDDELYQEEDDEPYEDDDDHYEDGGENWDLPF